MSPLRVCHLGKYYPPAPGGIESHVQTLARAQASLGLAIQVFCINHEAGPTQVATDGAVVVTRFGRRASVAKLDICPELVPSQARVEADVLHMHVPNPAMILGLIRARPAKPVVVTYHSDVVRQRVLGSCFRPLERLAYRQVGAVVTTSALYPAGSRFLRSYIDRIHFLPHGIDLRPYLDPSAEVQQQAARIREQCAQGGPLWLCAGRHVYYKGYVNAIRALTRVPGVLVLIGDGPEQRVLRAEARRLDVAHRLAFVGTLPHFHDVIPYYLAADALWFPSNARSEAFGLVQVEAMASGCPVINTRIPDSGVPWVSQHGKTGLTVPVDDPVALADAANRLLMEPGLRERLAMAGRQRAIQEFDHRVMAARSLAIYRHVLTGAPVTPQLRGMSLVPSQAS
jgi:rhamnosyl/mannosyltransferase